MLLRYSETNSIPKPPKCCPIYVGLSMYARIQQ